MKKLLFWLLVLLFSTTVFATTYYVEPGGSGVSDAIEFPGGLNDTWDDMCAENVVGDGDTIQLADGTYDNTTTDVPVDGLDDCDVDIDLTIEGESNDPTLCIVDFSGNTNGVDGFHITTTGTWLFQGLTIHGSQNTAGEGNITFTDGTLNVRNCIIHSSDKYGIKITSTNAAAAVYLYNCEIYGTADDGVTSGGDGGDDADHIQEAHYCYFHDITGAANTQGLTMHEEGTTKAYFCTFRNIGTGTPKTSGAAIGQGGVDPIYAYNCVVEDCYVGFGGSGGIEVRNCYIDAYTAAVQSAGGTDEVIIEDCIIRGNTGNSTILITQLGIGDLTIRNSILWGENTASAHLIYNSSGDEGLTLTLEDNIIYFPDTTDGHLIRFSGDWILRRNLFWVGKDKANGLGIFRNDDTGVVTMNLEHNWIRKGGTANLWYTPGTDTYTGSYNTITSGVTLSVGIDPKATDQFETITWRGFAKELMLSPNAGPYRDFGAAMMPGWYRPKGNMDWGAFCRKPIEGIDIDFVTIGNEDAGHLLSNYHIFPNPTNIHYAFGFRVASIAIEPSFPPVADANGPYVIYVGDSLTLDGSSSSSPDGDIVSYMWDLDDDEIFETDAGGQAVFTVDYAYLESLELLINYEYTIHLKVTDSEGQSDTAGSALIILPKPALQVAVDIKPSGCPNPLNVKSNGILPVVILGTADVNVLDIDPTSIQLAGVDVARMAYEDVAAPIADSNDCNCIEAAPDGLLDLTLKFRIQEIVEVIGEVNRGDELTLELTGVLFGERPIEGADCILIKGNHKPFNKADVNKDGVVNTIDIAIVAENWLRSSIVD